MLKVSKRGMIPPFIVMDVMRAANERAAAGKDVMHLEVGQPSTPAPRRVLEAAKAVNARENGPEIALMGTGEGGDWTRIHAPILGSSLVYSTMEDTFDIIRQGRINFEDLYIAWELLEYE